MSSVMDRTAFVLGASRDHAHATARVLGDEFVRVIVLDNSAAVGCRAGGAKSDPDGTILHLDTNGRPLRDWDD